MLTSFSLCLFFLSLCILKKINIDTIFTDKPPCPPREMSDLPSAPLDTGLPFNMVPGGVQVATPPSQSAVLSVPIQDQMERPTQPQIPLHHKHSEDDKENQELQPNRDQVYHIRGKRTYNASQLIYSRTSTNEHLSSSLQRPLFVVPAGSPFNL